MAASGLRRAPKLHPVTAFLLVLGVFILCSLVFNILMLVIDGLGLAGLLGSFLFRSIMIVLVALGLFAFPMAAAAHASRRFGKLIVVAATLVAGLVYVAALRFEQRFVTTWLFPHWPGVDLTYSRGEVELVTVCAVILGGVTCLMVSGMADESVSPPPDNRGDDATTASTLRDGLDAAGDQAALEDQGLDLEPDLG